MKVLFLTQFQAALRYAPLVTALGNVKQKERDTLPAYFKRFNGEIIGVRGATYVTLKSFQIAGLRVRSDF